MLSLEHSKLENSKNSKSLQQYFSFKNQTYPYLDNNLTAEHFTNTSNLAYPFSFLLKGYYFPIVIKSCTYQSARLKLFRFIRKQPNLKHVTYYHDRLFQSVNVSVS